MKTDRVLVVLQEDVNERVGDREMCKYFDTIKGRVDAHIRRNAACSVCELVTIELRSTMTFRMDDG